MRLGLNIGPVHVSGRVRPGRAARQTAEGLGELYVGGFQALGAGVGAISDGVVALADALERRSKRQLAAEVLTTHDFSMIITSPVAMLAAAVRGAGSRTGLDGHLARLPLSAAIIGAGTAGLSIALLAPPFELAPKRIIHVDDDGELHGVPLPPVDRAQFHTAFVGALMLACADWMFREATDERVQVVAVNKSRRLLAAGTATRDTVAGALEDPDVPGIEFLRRLDDSVFVRRGWLLEDEGHDRQPPDVQEALAQAVKSLPRGQSRIARIHW